MRLFAAGSRQRVRQGQAIGTKTERHSKKATLVKRHQILHAEAQKRL